MEKFDPFRVKGNFNFDLNRGFHPWLLRSLTLSGVLKMNYSSFEKPTVNPSNLSIALGAT